MENEKPSSKKLNKRDSSPDEDEEEPDGDGEVSLKEQLNNANQQIKSL